MILPLKNKGAALVGGICRHTVALPRERVLYHVGIFKQKISNAEYHGNSRTDVVICLASILLGPVEAFMVGGVGAFLGDFFFYPTPMFVSLVTHGLQAVVISLFTHKIMKNKPHLGSIIGVAVGAVIMVVGYSLGRAFIYSTPEYAIVKLPFQILQAVFGAVFGTVLAWRCGLRKLYLRLVAGK